MNRPFLSKILWATGSILFFGCSPTLPRVDSTSLLSIRATRPWATIEGLGEGRHLYASRCGSCHGLPKISSHSPEEWPHLVEWMAPKAKLDTTQTRQLLDWVLSVR